MNEQKERIAAYITELRKDPNFKWLEKFEEKFPQAEIFVVGGQVRDLLMGRASKDYDLVVRNVPGKNLEIFLGELGRVDLVGKSFGVFIFKPKGATIKDGIEIALPRTERSFNSGGYKDFEVTANPALPIKDDLKRRDFTINAMALNLKTGELVDPFKGQKDLRSKRIDTVGKPKQRFEEDSTRMLRAVRFAAQLDFQIHSSTLKAIKKYAPKMSVVAAERIKDEFNKILLSKNVEYGLNLLLETGLLKEILPELVEGVGMQQGKGHVYTVFIHLVKAAQYASENDYSLELIIAALFHDCGKPRTFKLIDGLDTYYNHEYVGEKMVKKAMQRLRYSREITDKVAHLVRNHMFYYALGVITDAGVRRLISKVGKENIDDLVRLRMADRIGMGRPKAKPFKLQELERRMKILQSDPLSVKMLKIEGEEMMKLLKLKPGIRLKYLKEALMSEVLDEPKKNTHDYLSKRLLELGELSDQELQKLAPNLKEKEEERKRNILKGFKGVK